ncbi:hypothetical protein [Olsenella uli]|uniref:hypothetical protein n=1 Tax=Olsenella uli TaxID=133926 RepID=UPI00325FC460
MKVEDEKKAVEVRAAEVAKTVSQHDKPVDTSVDRLALQSQQRAIAYGRSRGCP